MTDFEHWWYHEGSQGPNGMDLEEHCKRMCQIAWSNGAYKEREACAQYAENYDLGTPEGHDIAAAIRARSQE